MSNSIIEGSEYFYTHLRHNDSLSFCKDNKDNVEPRSIFFANEDRMIDDREPISPLDSLEKRSPSRSKLNTNENIEKSIGRDVRRSMSRSTTPIDDRSLVKTETETNPQRNLVYNPKSHGRREMESYVKNSRNLTGEIRENRFNSNSSSLIKDPSNLERSREKINAELTPSKLPAEFRPYSKDYNPDDFKPYSSIHKNKPKNIVITDYGYGGDTQQHNTTANQTLLIEKTRTNSSNTPLSAGNNHLGFSSGNSSTKARPKALDTVPSHSQQGENSTNNPELKKLRNQIELLVNEVSCLKEELAFHLDEKETFQQKLLEIAKDNDELVEEKAVMEEKISQMSKQNTAFNIENRELRIENEDCKNLLEATEKQLRNVKHTSMELEAINDRLRREKNEIEYYMSQSDQKSEKVYNTIKTLSLEKEDFQKKFLAECQRADEMEKRFQTQVLSLEDDKLELNRIINEQNRQMCIYETSINMLENEKGRLFDFNSSEKEIFKKKLHEHYGENEELKRHITELKREILTLQTESKKDQKDRLGLQLEAEELNKEILECKKILAAKIEEYDSKIMILNNKFDKEREEMKGKFKILQSRARYAEIQKNDEIRRYEGLVSNLSDRLYKYESKKQYYTEKFTKAMKLEDRAKSLGTGDSYGRLVNKSLAKFPSTKLSNDFSVEDINKTSGVDFKKKGLDLGIAKSLKETLKNSRSKLNLTNSKNQVLSSSLKKMSFSELKDNIDEALESNETIELLEKHIVTLNNDYKNIVLKLNIASNQAEIEKLKKKLDLKSEEIGRETAKLRQLKGDK